MRATLADYQLLGPFGPGGEQDGTWLARPPARLSVDASTVVVTELDDPGADDWAALAERLSDLAGIRNEHLPRLLEAGRTSEGGTTVAWVARDHADARPFAAAPGQRNQALAAAADAARAAHALHEAGWAHGDIRPAAVLVAGDRVILEPPLQTAATNRVLAGPRRTPVGFDPVDPTSLWGEGPSRAGDIWSLGATAHALVTGRLVHPSLASDPIVTAAQRILIEGPQLAPELDGALEALLQSCLAPDPSARPPSAADLAEQLDRLANGQ